MNNVVLSILNNVVLPILNNVVLSTMNNVVLSTLNNVVLSTMNNIVLSMKIELQSLYMHYKWFDYSFATRGQMHMQLQPKRNLPRPRR